MKKLRKLFLGLVSLTLIFPVTALACNTYSGQFTRASNSQAYVSNNMGITTGAFSVSLWVNFTTPPSGNAYYYFQRQSAAKSEDDWTYGESAGTYTLGFIHYQSPANNVTYTSNLGTTWHQIVETYDGTNLNYYLDGSLILGPYNGFTSDGGVPANIFSLALNNGQDMTGLIDDARVYNIALSASTISSNYSSPSEISCSTTNLIAYYRLNNDWNDCTSNAYNLTTSGSPTFSTTVAFNDCVAAVANKEDDDWFNMLLAFMAQR